MGKVYLVGAGPGDPELLTLKAYRLIKEADVILFDALVNKEILKFAKQDCIKIYVGKRESRHTISQEEINELLYRFSKVYEKVVRLKGGDPFVFGRGGEEVLFLREKGIEVEVIPGVTSFLGASASAEIPLTIRGISSSFAVISGHPNRKIDWNVYSKIDTLIVLMGVKRRREIAKKLIEAGRKESEPVAFIENATTTQEKIIFTTLKELASNPPEVNPPAVMVIGDVVRTSKFFNNKNSFETLIKIS
ncbi:MAG: uroporphyrinogen-III C-methyltransferase [Aquifex sp.]|nr:MAG: uroporphyrinogen-III C-methyltransferase [Aquifex sp.]